MVLVIADRIRDEARGDRRAVKMQDRHQPYRIDAVLVDDQLPQLAVAILLDDVDEIVVGDEARDARVEREGADAQAVEDFIHEHDKVFIVEQNRDAQLRTMLMADFTLDARKLIPVLHFDGTPITARFIAGDIAKKLDQMKVVPFEKAAS